MRIWSVLRRAALAAAVIGSAFAALLAFPSPLFAYTHNSGSLTFRSDAPIDAAGADAVARAVRATLDASPFPIGDEPYTLYVANDDWRRRLYFILTPGAGGFVVPPLTPRHTFLSGADFPSKRLRAPSGRLLEPPRTLAYFGAHEISHLLAAQRTGYLRHVMMPEWVREGIADYAALGPVRDLAALRKELGDGELGQRAWDAHGYYVRYRMLVTHYLVHEKWTLDRLLATNLSEAAAQSAMDARLAGGV